MAFGPNTVIQPTPVPFREPPSELIDDRGEFTDNEVRGMNQDYIKDELNYAYFSKDMNCAKSCVKAVLEVISA